MLSESDAGRAASVSNHPGMNKKVTDKRLSVAFFADVCDSTARLLASSGVKRVGDFAG